MAYAASGGEPWHKLGNPVGDAATVEEMKERAGLGWKTLTAPLVYEWDGEIKETDRWAMFRSDNGQVLDYVGPRYVPFQNDEILEFFREYVEAGDMRLETAGSLEDGRWIWALAKMNVGFSLKGDDRVELYVLLANPNIYGKGGIAKLTEVRVVCWNTLMQALGSGEGLKLWHTREFNAEMRDEAKERLGIAKSQVEDLKNEAILLSRTKLDDKQAFTLSARIFELEKDELLMAGERRPPKEMARTLALYHGEGTGSDMPSSKDTAWGLLNGVTQFVDHEYGRTPSRRLERAWFGQGDYVKRRAKRVLLEHANR
jgi:phage/plasmid-like protein (TIGR03299 family)